MATNTKTKWDDELFARIFTRKVSGFFSSIISRTPLSANQVTVIDILMGIIAAILFVPGVYYVSILAAIALQLWYIFDCVDGEVARIKGQTSLAGMYLDYIGHDLVQPMVFIGIGFGLFLQDE